MLPSPVSNTGLLLSLTLARLLTVGSITVIVLIAAEIIVAAVNIVVDLYAGVD